MDLTVPAATRIRLFDLNRQFAAIGPEIRAALDEVFAAATFIKGPFVAAFERAFAAYLGIDHAVGVSSGTTGLELLFRAYGIGAGDEVIVPANTSVATAMAASNVGAQPVLVDVDPATGNLDPGALGAAVGPRTRAVVPVHLWGRPAPMDEVVAFARERGMLVIEDASQAHGARYRGTLVGTIGDAAAFSLHPSKNLGAYGDAGIVVTRDPAIAQAVAELRDIGQTARYVHDRIGTNGRLDPLQAAVLSVKLRYLDDWIAGRRAAAERYARAFAGTAVRAPQLGDHEFAVFHLYVVRVPAARRAAICAALDAAQIDWGIHYPTPVHLQGAYRGDREIARAGLPAAEAVAHDILSIPMFAELRDDETARVAQTVLGALD